MKRIGLSFANRARGQRTLISPSLSFARMSESDESSVSEPEGTPPEVAANLSGEEAGERNIGESKGRIKSQPNKELIHHGVLYS